MGTRDPFTRLLPEGALLSPESQKTLLDQFHAGREAKESLERQDAPALSHSRRLTLKKAVSSGEAALTQLLGATYRLAIKQANDIVRARYGPGHPDLYEEARAEAYLALMEALVTFTPQEEGSLAGFVSMLVERRVRASLRGPVPDAWSRVYSQAKEASSALYARLGRTPTDAELKEEVEEYATRWAKDHLPENTPVEEREALAKKKLIRQGTRAALANIGRIQAMLGAPLSLDATTSDGPSLQDSLSYTKDEDPSALSWFLDSLPEPVRQMVALRFGLEGAAPMTYEEIATRIGATWTEVRSEVTCALSRMSAPHAHYAALAPNLASQVDFSPQTASSRLKSRRALTREVASARKPV